MSLKYTIGDLIWATLRGQCPWPGRVSDPPTDLEHPKENLDYHCIYFFGQKKYKWVRERNLKPYEKFEEEMMRYCITEGFMDAIDQIVEYMENPENFTQFGHEVDIKDEVDPKLEFKEEVDEPLVFSDDQRDSDDSNDCEPMDTSVVDQETDKKVECSMLARVLLQRVTIYECEVCAVCFLKRKEFERHKETHMEEIEDKENSIETRKEHDNFNNNSNICDKNENEKRRITFTILDNEIKLKFKNGKLQVPPLLNPVVALDRIEASKCEICDQCFLDPQEYRIHEMSHLHTARSKVTEDKNSSHIPYTYLKSEVRFSPKSTINLHSIVQDPFFICHCGIRYNRFEEYKRHRKLVHSENVSNREDTSNVKAVQVVEDESDREAQKSEVNGNTLSTNKRQLNSVAKKIIIKTKLGLVPRIKAKKPVKENKLKTKGKRHGKQKKERRKNANSARCSDPKLVYSCTLCKKTFSCKWNLEVHQVVHTKVKPYPCDQCEKRFTQAGNLKRHLKRHAGIGDFGCQYCPKVFINLGSRNIHERTYTGTKPYLCDLCKKEFSDPSAYNRHIRTHTGEKIYKCDICFKRYTESGPLQRHKLSVHEAIECKICSKSFCFAFELRKHFQITH